MDASSAAARPRWIVALDGVAVVAFLGLFAWGWLRLGAWPPGAWWPGLLVCAVAGVAAADLATGLVHWWGDHFFAESTPWIGRVLIQPFREHHRDPGAMLRHGFLEVTGNNALGLLPALAGLVSLAPLFGRDASASGGWCFLAAFCAVAFVANPIHRWAHMGRRRLPAPVAWLQRRGWILSPAEHARHHRGRHDRAFCVATGWMNPILDRLVAPSRRSLRG